MAVHYNFSAVLGNRLLSFHAAWSLIHMHKVF